jgi:hypothetical protein
MRRVALLLLLLLPLAPASAAGASPTEAERGPFSARFYEATTYLVEGERQLDVLEGAFDWDKEEGWAERRYANGAIHWRQVAGTCFARAIEEPWQREKGGCGIVEMLFDPAETYVRLRRFAGLQKVGERAIEGVRTVHYRATWDEADKGALDVWVDEAEIVRRIVTRVNDEGGDSETRSIEYVDFGIDVDVDAPLPSLFPPPKTGPSSEDGAR